MTLRRTLGVGVLLGFACAVGCSTSGAPEEALGRGSLAIQNGQLDTTHTYAVGLCIGGSQNGDCPYICSGALIAPNLVVTARHCVQDVPNPDNVDCSTDHFSGSHGTVRVTTYSTVFQSTKGWHTAANVIVPTPTGVCGNDLALLILKDVVPSSEATPVTPDVQYAMTDNDAFPGIYETAIGYGNTGTSTNDAGTRRIRQNITIQCIPGDPLLDCPDAGGIFTSNEFLTGDGTCSGDSGSSAFDQDSFNKGAPISMGVLSRGGQSGGTCVGGIYTRLDVWKDLIVQTVKQAATAGGYAVPSWTQPPPPKTTDAGTKKDATAPASGTGQIGDTCGKDGDCASNVCAAPTQDGALVCSQSCDASQSGSCPDGYSCNDGYCFVADSSGGGGNGAQSTTTTSGCSIVLANGPTHPVPWRGVGLAVATLGLVAVGRRRRRRAG